MLQDRGEAPAKAENLSRAGTPARGLGGALVLGAVFLKELGQFFGHGATQFLGIDDGDGALVIAGHVMADADGDEFDGRLAFDVGNDLAQVASRDSCRS